MIPLEQWRDDAACKGKPTHWWFPSRGQTATKTTKQALMICRDCPVRRQCLVHGRRNEPYGIWGGELQGDRRREAKWQ